MLVPSHGEASGQREGRLALRFQVLGRRKSLFEAKVRGKRAALRWGGLRREKLESGDAHALTMFGSILCVCV